jgi:hypothetical protein
VLVVLWLLLSCDPAPASLPARIEDCPDAACRQEWILHPEHSDPATQAAALQTITQPEERILLIQQILSANPRQPPEICNQLPSGDALRYCERIQDRPHLSEQPPAPSTPHARPGGGPANTELGGGSEGGFVPRLSAATSGCEEAVDARACRSQEALRSAAGGQLEAAARSCLAISAGRWRGECMFSAAEQALEDGAPYARAFQLCMAAEPFTQQCHSHLISAMAIRSPGATAPASDWERSISRAGQITGAWADIDPMLGGLMVDRFWSEAVRLSYLEQPAVGDPLDHLPPESWPHIRAAVVWRLVESAETPAADLKAWTEQGEAALASRAESPVAAMTVHQRRRLSLQVQDYWVSDRPGEEDIPATFFLATARRPTDPDPRTDLQLCILESLARQDHAPSGLFDAAAQSGVAVIAWSARRLQQRMPRQ